MGMCEVNNHKYMYNNNTAMSLTHCYFDVKTQVHRSITELLTQPYFPQKKILSSFAETLTDEYGEKTTPLLIFVPFNLSFCMVLIFPTNIQSMAKRSSNIKQWQSMLMPDAHCNRPAMQLPISLPTLPWLSQHYTERPGTGKVNTF